MQLQNLCSSRPYARDGRGIPPFSQRARKRMGYHGPGFIPTLIPTLLPTLCPRLCPRLGGDAVGEGIVVVGGVVTQFEPAASRFEGVGHAVFLIGGKILPGVVTGDRQV